MSATMSATMSRAILVTLALVALTACGDATAPGDAPLGEELLALPWKALARVTLSAEGRSEALALTTPPEGYHQALRVRGEGCFQLIGAADEDGDGVGGPWPGSFCRRCARRSSVVVDEGLFVFPADEGRVTEVAFGRVDCATQTPTSGEGQLEVEQLDYPATRRETLALRLVLSPEMETLDREAVMAELSAAWRDVGITPHLVGTVILGDRPTLEVGPGDVADMAELLAALPPRAETTVDVVIGPCVLRDDPLFGPPAALAGFAPRIPGGAGPADAVFVADRNCGSRNEAAPSPATIARLVAHELGHHFGLFHVEEEDGTEDDLGDTDGDNLMHRQPLRAEADGLTPQQVTRMLSHPILAHPILAHPTAAVPVGVNPTAR